MVSAAKGLELKAVEHSRMRVATHMAYLEDDSTFFLMLIAYDY